MYWFYLVIFIVAVLVPDIVRQDFLGMPQERIEELLIFILGMIGILIFILKEHQFEAQRREKFKEQRKLQQTSKDLVDSYSYIGEINRKMDMLMQIGSNLSNSDRMDEKKEKEIFNSIIDAAIFLLKGKGASLVFYNVKNEKIAREICSDKKCRLAQKSKDFFAMGENIYVKSIDDFIIFSSNRNTQDIRSYLIVRGFSAHQGQDNNNQEILKYLTVQALFIYSNFVGAIKTQSI